MPLPVLIDIFEAAVVQFVAAPQGKLEVFVLPRRLPLKAHPRQPPLQPTLLRPRPTAST